MNFDTNNIFSLAADIVANTSQSVFLTGKAGTGKTTFLHYIRNTVDKNIIVAAPTGVAAINAGGVTLHSLMQLPFEPFVPNAEGRKKLDYHIRLRKSKIEMLQELELLIIDEVSMLRADMLDSIDFILRRYRNNQQPFGGVQMLFIGDLFQLPPVVQNREWSMLQPYYASPFFFHAQALNGNVPLYIELKKIYRQSDQEFIDILNRIRNNQTISLDLELLNKRYNPTFNPQQEQKYVTLCTHNYKADQVNISELEQLPSAPHSFKGEVKGDFAENAYPTEINLSLKLNAQVIFVKNDVGEQRRYYNGKLATISYLSDTKICVQFEDASEMELERETWRNIRYTLNQDTGEIEEEELGHFSQYPIRLAWAITIHKSQGLTFDRVIIDAGQAFAAGQVYVALSRCTSLDGIVLYSKITPASIQTDREALAYAREEKTVEYLEQILEHEKPNYCTMRLKAVFNWSPIIRSTRAFYELVLEKKIPKQEEAQAMASKMCDKVMEQEEVARNFCRELDRLLYNQNKPDIELLKDRVQKAAVYFHGEIQEHLVSPIATHLESLENVTRIKLYLRRVGEIQSVILNFLNRLENIHFGNIDLTEGLKFAKLELAQVIDQISEKKDAPKKGDSQRVTLLLFEEGKSIAQIEAERNLTKMTVENHLISFMKTGEVKAAQLIDKETILHLTPLLERFTLGSALKAIKENIPSKYTYFDIRVMLNHLHKNNN